MSTEVFCPNCGGLLFGSDSEGGRPCTCAPTKANSSGGATATTTKSGKACCVCGVDLEGKPRRKDKEGKYWCNECADYDSAQKRLTSGTVCADCGNSFSKSMITEVEGKKICRTCAIDREMQKKETKERLANAKYLRSSNQEESRKKKLMIIIGVLGVLILLVLYMQGIIGGGE